jgi:hypothetical protein
MKKVYRLILIPILLIAIAFIGYSVDLESAQLTVNSEKAEGNRITYEVEDKAGNEFTVVGGKDFSRTQITIITELKDSFFGWKYMTVSYLRIIVDENRAEVLVVPEKYTYDKTDIELFMPSGMQFFFDAYLEYDFRMKVENIFVRMRGQFFDEDQFSARLVSAIRDPAMFVAINDPEYMIKRVIAAEEEIIRLDNKDKEILESLYGTITDYEDYKMQGFAFYNDYLSTKTDYESVKKDYLELKDEGIRLKKDYLDIKKDYLDVKDDHLKLRGEHEDLLLKHEALEDRFENLLTDHGDLGQYVDGLTEELTILRTAFLTQGNTGLFRGPTPIDSDLVIRVLDIRRSNAALTSKEIVAMLKEEEVKTTTKIVELIVRAFIGEFEE